MSTTIRILPPTLVNRIAAGEVIERPASVIKELVENAVDAGATAIDIILEQGGKSLIRVSDNGNGMDKDMLALSVQRHATSKLPSDDLLRIDWLGFRGEALPSIGSVSRLSVTSRARGAHEGWMIRVEGGDVYAPAPAALAVGTRVEVRDLFYATPARLKFLKSERSETQAVQDMAMRLAMAHPEVSLSLTIDGKRGLHCNAAQGNLLDGTLARLDAVLGRDFAANAVPVDFVREDIVLTGFAGVPTYHRATSAAQYLFVNQRPVRDRLLIGSLKAAYHDFLAHGRHPVVVLYLDVPPEQVDVNVHPAKAEVRFREAALVRSMLVNGIKQALMAAGHKASTSVAQSAIDAFRPLELATASMAQSQPITYFSEPSARAYQAAPSFSMPLPPQARSQQGALAQWLQTPGEEDLLAYPLGAARAQLHKTYILAETKDGFILVDQHAAHERLTYERMKAYMASGEPKRQKLLIPEVVALEPGAAARVLAQTALLEKAGLIVDGFGEDTLAVREVPALLAHTDIQGLVKDLADVLLETGEPLALQEKIANICGNCACKNSIKAGRALSLQEMNALLRDMEKTPHSGQCNHGRPTYIELKKHDIERLFGRR